MPTAQRIFLALLTFVIASTTSRAIADASHHSRNEFVATGTVQNAAARLTKSVLKQHSTPLRVKNGVSVHRVVLPAAYLPEAMTWRNTGTVPITMKVRSTGEIDATSEQSLIAGVIRDGMTDEQKAKAIFDFLVAHTYHWFSPNPLGDGPDDDVHDPVRFINVYGYGFCDDAARNFVILARAAALPARIWYLNGHVVAEARFDDSWHMFDVDHKVYYRAGDHIASVEELENDPAPILRSSRDAVGYDSALIASMYTSAEDNRALDEEYPRSQGLAPRLEPGDRVEFPYTGGTKFFSTECNGAQPPPSAGNGTITRNLTPSLSGTSAETSTVFEWPYLLLDATLRLRVSAPVNDIDVAIRDVNRERRTNLQRYRLSNGEVEIPLDFNCGSQPVYRVQITLTSRSATPLRAVISHAELAATFQFAPRMLPDLRKRQFIRTIVESSEAGGRALVEFSANPQTPRREPARTSPPLGPAIRIRSGGRLDTPRVMVPVGTVVRWLAVEGGHDLSFADGAKSGPLDSGTEFTRRFDAPGTFHYGCTAHGEAHDGGEVQVFNPVAGDFDLDGRADLLWWNSASSTLQLWHLEGSHFRSSPLMDHAAGSEWTPECAGDMNGDGFADIVWRNVRNGELHVWLLRRTLYIGTLAIRNAVPPGWRASAVLPVDRNGRAGLVLENSATGVLDVWRLKGRSAEECEPMSLAIQPPSRLVGIGDFDADLAPDAAIWNPVTRELSFTPLDWDGTATVIGSVQDGDWEPALIGDTDGDGEPNVVWRNERTGEVNIWSLRHGMFWRGVSVGSVTQPGWNLIPS